MDEKKRLCVIAPEIGSGGVEAVLLNYFSYIDRSKLSMDLMTYEITNLERKKKFEALGFRLIKVPKKKNGLFRSVQAMYREFNINKYDIVHSHMTMWNCIPMFLAWKCKIPVRISHSHLAIPSQRLTSKMLLIVQRLFIKMFSTKLCACGEDAAIFLYGKSSYQHGKVEVINNAIDVSKFRPDNAKRISMRKSLGIADNTFCVGHIGRFHEHKNHCFLIDIFEEVCRIHPDSQLLLVGDGDLKDLVQEKVIDKKLASKVKFLGVRDDPEAIYQAMDVFCLPSLYEGLPVVGIEAQAVGLPCFFSDCVSSKVMVTKLAQSISLSKSAHYWAENLVGSRGLIVDEAFPAEYDIRKMAYIWEKMYFQMN